MPLPLPANATCAIYRNGSAPPTTPAAASVNCYLKASYEEGLEHGEDELNFQYSHTMLVDLSVDIRDGYNRGSIAPNACDHVYVPDQDGTKLNVMFVERPYANALFKRVYLARQTPSWPTDEV